MWNHHCVSVCWSSESDTIKLSMRRRCLALDCARRMVVAGYDFRWHVSHVLYTTYSAAYKIWTSVFVIRLRMQQSDCTAIFMLIAKRTASRTENQTIKHIFCIFGNLPVVFGKLWPRCRDGPLNCFAVIWVLCYCTLMCILHCTFDK